MSQGEGRPLALQALSQRGVPDSCRQFPLPGDGAQEGDEPPTPLQTSTLLGTTCWDLSRVAGKDREELTMCRTGARETDYALELV